MQIDYIWVCMNLADVKSGTDYGEGFGRGNSVGLGEAYCVLFFIIMNFDRSF